MLCCENTRKVCNSELEAIDFFFLDGFPTSGDFYFADKPMESAVCYFNDINFNCPWVYRCNKRLLFDQSGRSWCLHHFIKLYDNNFQLFHSNIS